MTKAAIHLAAPTSGPYGPSVSVRRLAPLDALFLAAETPVNRLHVMAIIALDPSTVPGGYRFERLRGHIADRLHLVPPLRQRLLHLPLGLDLPVWVEESEVDVRFHVRHRTPGARVDAAQLAAFASSLDEAPLDPNRPLWEMHVAEGLDVGHIAVVAKLHHALMDGMAGMSFMAALFSFAPKAPEPPLRVPRDDSDRTAPRRCAGPATEPAHGTAHGVRGDGERRRTRGRERGAALLSRAAERTPAPASCRGGPVALHGDDDTDRPNAMSLMFTSLATDIEDPEERLRAAHDATRAAKRLREAIGPEFLPGLSGLAPPFALAATARLYALLS